MHKYLNAIGFSNLKSRKEINKLLSKAEYGFTSHELVSYEEGLDFCEYRKEYGDGIGITVCGVMDVNERFEREYYFPYLKGHGITSNADIIVERRIEKEQYIGVCEDVKVGVSLIFHLQNAVSYMREKQLGNIPKSATSVTLTGLASSGMVLFPVMKNEMQERASKEESINRKMLITAARNGDQTAIESLTLDDIDLYSKVSRRLITEDVFSIVDTYFMPYGLECDQYSILGEILELKQVKNELSTEILYIMTLDVNEMQFDICVSADSIIGEPQVGRRFKGNIWLQGHINF